MANPEDLSKPLSETEMDRLDHSLAERPGVDRVGEEVEYDEGILSVSELDGFLTAIVSGPNAVPPSVWLPAVWGECEPEWRTEDEALEVFALMMRHMNSVAVHLTEEPGTFEPMFLTGEIEGREDLLVEPWCAGYVRAIALDGGSWRDGGKGMESLLQPIFMFGTPEGWDGLDALSDQRLQSLQEEIAPAVRAIHGFWLQRRSPGGAGGRQPQRRDAPRVGRNDPCPCGSGRKYKHCCLH